MRIFRYRLPLKPPVPIGDGLMAQREGFLLEQDGRWADVAPLPGFSHETLDEVRNALTTCHNGEAPSVDFGRWCLERTWQPCAIPVGALLTGTPEAILGKSRSLSRSNCPAVKLKVGRHDVQRDIELTKQVRRLLRPEQRLRLDANRAWPFEVAAVFAQGVADQAIEYVEEPLKDPFRLEELVSQTGLPYALDETLAECQDLQAFSNVTALIVKPTILGGRKRVDALAATGRQLIFSACFESGVGIAHIAQIASEYAPHCSAGLDTYSYLDRDVLASPLSFSNWILEVPDVISIQNDLVNLLPS